MPKIKKTKNILNNWLQRDLTLFGRVLLSKAEGLSRYVYPALSLYVSDKTSKVINKTFLDFIWKNKPCKLKKDIISGKKIDGGLEMLDFFDINNTFKLNWLRNCQRNENSLWFFIPQSIFKELGGLPFLLRCNYIPGKLPIKLSTFHQQVLLAWKIGFHHNFSPHKMLLWNNCLITSWKKSLFLHKWFERNIYFVMDLFDENGNVLSYEAFMFTYNFPIPAREFQLVVKAIPDGLKHLMKSHLTYGSNERKLPELIIDGIILSFL